MGNKNTERKKRNKQNRKRRKKHEDQVIKYFKYADTLSENELIHIESCDDQGFVDFLECGDK